MNSVLLKILPAFFAAALLQAPGAGAGTPQDVPQGPVAVRSPGGGLEVVLELGSAGGKDGVPSLRIAYRGRTLFEGCRLGVDLAGSGPLASGLRITGVERRGEDRIAPVFPGKTSSVRERFQEAAVSLEETAPPRRRLGIVLRAYDDGAAFRYLFPGGDEKNDVRIAEELTRFVAAGDPRAYPLPLEGFTTSYENYYAPGPLSEAARHPLIALPLLLEFPGRIWAAVTEAALIDFAGLYLKADPASPGRLEARLSPQPGRPGVKVLARAPHVSPWRVVLAGDAPGKLIESDVVLALNEPCALADTSWIRPGKTTFPWWNGFEAGSAGFKAGLDTRTMLHYIDFCAEQGIPYHSLDGFEIAWYGGRTVPYEGADITRSIDAIDLPAVIAHAREKGVRLRLWLHWEGVKKHMDRAFPLYEKWGIEGIMLDFLDRDDQEMVQFEMEVIQKAARYHLTVTIHGIHKPTGISRTYPNLLTYEGVLNLEYDKWSKTGSSPEHELLVPFTRMLAGPLDYHQGSFRSVRPEKFEPRNIAPVVIGTRARMLAMYVVYEDPLPMMVDYPAAYRGQPGLEFVVRVPTVWDETRVLAAEVGDSIAVARRSGKEWYVGAMCAARGRELALPLDFLGAGDFAAEIYSDPPDLQAPAERLVEKRCRVDAAVVARARLAPAGGYALRIRPASGADAAALPLYSAD